MAKMAAQPDFQEIGSTGLQRTSGFVIDDFITNLRGVQGMRVWREMSDNDPVVGAMLYAIERLILAIEWNVEPYTEKKTDSIKRKDQVQADFIKECMDDMSESWPAMLSQILSFLPFGFAYCEIVYKKRQGPDQKDSRRKSKYSDGKVGWRKIPLRAQETLWDWEFDENGSIMAMRQ